MKMSKILNTGKALALPVGVYLLFSLITQGRFATVTSLMSVFRTAVVPLLLAMSLSFGMSMGMWNFSVGAVVYACAIFSANIARAMGMGLVGICIFSVLIGILINACMGFLYNKLRIPCLVLSLGFVMIIEALPNIIIPDSTGSMNLTDGILGSAPWCYVVVGIMFLIFTYINNFTVFGSDSKAIGANIKIADSAGINIDKAKFLSFIISGIFLGVAGFEFLSINVSVIAVTGFSSSGMIFDGMMGIFIAMVLIKYIDYNVAVIIGVITIRMLGAGLVACGLSSEIRGLLTGVFLLAVMIYSANAGVFDKMKARKNIAEDANREYELIKTA